MPKKKLKTIIIISVIFILIISGVYAYFSFFSKDSETGQQNPSGQTVVVTEENFYLYLSSLDFVQDLPSSAVISLKTTNKEYSITKSSAVEGKAENPDMTISIPSSYISKLGKGFCAVLDEAKTNGDLGIETHISQTSLLWKYKSMTKYRSCLGF